MPIYEYACLECGREFEELVRGDERPACPDCGKDHLERRHQRAGGPRQPARERLVPPPAPARKATAAARAAACTINPIRVSADAFRHPSRSGTSADGIAAQGHARGTVGDGSVVDHHDCQFVSSVSRGTISRSSPMGSQLEIDRVHYGRDIAARIRTTPVGNKPMLPSDALLRSCRLVDEFEQLGIRYYICGSLAGSLYGKPRATLDADLVADINKTRRPVVMRLKSTYYIDGGHDSRGDRPLILLQPDSLCTSFKVDVFVIKNRPYDEKP